MKKKIFAALICASMIGCLAATPVLADETVKADGDYKIAVITMDSVDQHWVSLKEGAEEEAKADDVTVDFMAPDVKDDAKQIECINNAVAGGYDALMVAANSEDAVSGALQEAIDAGMKLVYVDSPANVEAEATFSTDNKAAGKTAGEEMIKALEDKGVKDGSIGIVNINNSTNTAIQREAGFREAFEGTDYELLETQFCEGDAAKAQTIAENYITEGVVGIYGTNEGASTGVGNAIKASGSDEIIGVGFDKSDTLKGLIEDGYLVCTMAQNPDVMGSEGVKAAVKAGADIIISGAGLPTELPALVSGSKTKIAPIVSTDKSAKVILKYWERKYKRTADLVVIEGPQAGGHLGFHKEELDSYTPEAYDNEIRKIVQTALDRNRKKLSLQQKQMKDTEKKDKYKVYGELINTYGYGLEEGCKSFKAVNYYNGEEITIPLDPTLTPQENSKKYFDRYGKLKRTQEALEVQIADTTSEIHLQCPGHCR